jgi:hypothetical protein
MIGFVGGFMAGIAVWGLVSGLMARPNKGREVELMTGGMMLARALRQGSDGTRELHAWEALMDGEGR